MTAQLEDRIRESMRTHVNVRVSEPNVTALHRRRHRKTQRRAGVGGAMLAVVAITAGVVANGRINNGDNAVAERPLVGFPAFGYQLVGDGIVPLGFTDSDGVTSSIRRWLLQPLTRTDSSGRAGGTGRAVYVAEGPDIGDDIQGRRADIAGRPVIWLVPETTGGQVIMTDLQSQLQYVTTMIPESVLEELVAQVEYVDGAPQLPRTSGWMVTEARTPIASSRYKIGDRFVRVFSGDLVDLATYNLLGDWGIDGATPAKVDGLTDAAAISIVNRGINELLVVDVANQRAIRIAEGSESQTPDVWTADELRVLLTKLQPLDERTWLAAASEVKEADESSLESAPVTAVEASAAATTAALVPIAADPGEPLPKPFFDRSLVSAGRCAGATPGVQFASLCVPLRDRSPGFELVDLSNVPEVGGGRAVIVDVGLPLKNPQLELSASADGEPPAQRSLVSLEVDGRSLAVIVEDRSITDEGDQEVTLIFNDEVGQKSLNVFVQRRVPLVEVGAWVPMFGTVPFEPVARLMASRPGADFSFVSISIASPSIYNVFDPDGSTNLNLGSIMVGVSRSSDRSNRLVTVGRKGVSVSVSRDRSAAGSSFEEMERRANEIIDAATGP
jgi:hypothetical protein